ncbi:hypothetical protein T484DRAFT_1817497 [Baffinella frigidus]|nr:hypothetical protein T484DRAFT_1817497 [Cryptophyta sp. CCMP2293]
MLALIGVVVALLAVIAGWFMTQKKPEKVAAPPPKEDPEPEEKKSKPGKGAAGLAAKKKETKPGSHPNMLCAFKGHTGDVTDFKKTAKWSCGTSSGNSEHGSTVGEDRKVIVWDLKKLPPTQAQNLSPELAYGIA